MSQVGVRPASQMSTGRMGVTLPQIQHPLSRMSNPNDMDVRGVSRSGDRPMSNPLAGRPLASESHYPLRKSMSALSGRESRQASRMGRENIPPNMPIESIPEGVEVTFGDPNKTRMPIFGTYYFFFQLLLYVIVCEYRGLSNGKFYCITGIKIFRRTISFQ